MYTGSLSTYHVGDGGLGSMTEVNCMHLCTLLAHMIVVTNKIDVAG